MTSASLSLYLDENISITDETSYQLVSGLYQWIISLWLMCHQEVCVDTLGDSPPHSVTYLLVVSRLTD